MANLGTATVAEYLPFFRYKNVASTTWGATAGSSTVADPKVSSNSIVIVIPTSLPNGIWYVSSQTAGTGFVITSSDSENTGTTFNYIIL